MSRNNLELELPDEQEPMAVCGKYATQREIDTAALRDTYLKQELVIAKADAAGEEPDLDLLKRIEASGMAIAERLDQQQSSDLA